MRNGVFFTAPAPLPRGRHTLSREQVAAAQRERLLVACTELLAAHGYRRLTHGEIAHRAGVSLASFYENFETKDACVFAGYDRFVEVLLERLSSVPAEGKGRVALVRDTLAAYLDTLQSDPVVARAYQVEIDALGSPARERRRTALQLFARYIQDLIERTSPANQTPQRLSWSAYIGVVYAARQLASDALDDDPDPNLSALAHDLEIWLSDLFR